MDAVRDTAFAAELRGFGLVGILAVLLILLAGNVIVGGVVIPVGAVFALIWVRASRTPWREIGYARPRSWARTIALGIALGVALKFLMKAVVMPLLGADPINQAYHYLAGNRAMLPVAIWGMIAAGFAEETVFRGFMFERFGKVLGDTTRATVAIVLITSLWFGLSHLSNQGAAGMQQATIVGLAYGTMFAVARQIFVVMITHASFNLTALAIIYFDVESEVARFIFR